MARLKPCPFDKAKYFYKFDRAQYFYKLGRAQYFYKSDKAQYFYKLGKAQYFYKLFDEELRRSLAKLSPRPGAARSCRRVRGRR